MLKILDKTFEKGGRIDNLNIILTHGDIDGLISAHQIVNYLEETNTPQNWNDYIVVSSLNPVPQETSKMLKKVLYLTGKKYLDHQTTIWVLDRASLDLTMLDINSLRNAKYIVIDHHETSEVSHKKVLKNFKKAEFIFETGMDNSAATNVFHYLLDKFKNKKQKDDFYNYYNKIVTVTRNWDTFKWTTENEEEQQFAKMFQACDSVFPNTLLWNYLTNFVPENSKKDNDLFTNMFPKMKLAWEIFEAELNEQYDFYKNISRKSSIEINFKENKYNLVILPNPQNFTSLISYMLFQDVRDLDAIIFLLDNGIISVRTNMKSTIYANELAAFIATFNGFTGGGHPQAAAGKIKDFENIKKELKNLIYQALEIEIQ